MPADMSITKETLNHLELAVMQQSLFHIQSKRQVFHFIYSWSIICFKNTFAFALKHK